jgi:FMN-dependent NADH-azoreductase
VISTGLEPRFITADLTLAGVTPAMAGLIPLATKSLAAAEQAIDGPWAPVSALASGIRRNLNRGAASTSHGQ